MNATDGADNNVPLLMRLQHKGDLRNTDKTRLTSLAWAALELSVEVFEWLLLEYGHDDSELSRVSPPARVERSSLFSCHLSLPDPGR